jgi:hypothetical protein
MTDTNLISQDAVTKINFLKFGSKQLWLPLLKWLHFVCQFHSQQRPYWYEKSDASQIITLCWLSENCNLVWENQSHGSHVSETGANYFYIFNLITASYGSLFHMTNSRYEICNVMAGVLLAMILLILHINSFIEMCTFKKGNISL